MFEGAEMPDGPHREFEGAWRRRLVPARDAAYHGADRAALWSGDELPESDWSLERLGFLVSELAIEPGEEAAQARLKAFLPKLTRYRGDPTPTRPRRHQRPVGRPAFRHDLAARVRSGGARPRLAWRGQVAE